MTSLIAHRTRQACCALTVLLPSLLCAGNPTLISRSADGTPGDDSSGIGETSNSARIALSADGRYVVFVSRANNLVAGVSDAFAHAFLHDRQAGTVTVVDTDSQGALANGGVLSVAISNDGTAVAVESCATNLAGGDLNGACDVFVKTLASGVM